MISQISNQPNFKGRFEGVLKSKGAAHKLPIITTAKDDMNMFMSFSNLLNTPQGKKNINVSLSQNGQSLSFTTNQKFFRDNLPHPMQFLYDRAKGFPKDYKIHRKEYYASRLMYHNKVQSLTFSVSKDDFAKAKTTTNNIIKDSKTKNIFEYAKNTFLKAMHQFCVADSTKRIIPNALPKADHTKAKDFFKG